MALNEKALTRAMENAYKGGGYIVSFGGGSVQIAGPDWLVMMSEEALPRKALALIVEHVGYIPAESCLQISKSKDGANVQTYMKSAFVAMALEMEMKDTGVLAQGMVTTRINAWGYTVLAGTEAKRVCLIKPDLGALGVDALERTTLTAGNCLRTECWDDDSDTRIVSYLRCLDLATLSPAKNSVLESLSGISWADEETGTEPEPEDGQTSLDDESDDDGEEGEHNE